MRLFLDGRAPSGGIGRRVRWLRRSLEERLAPGECVIFGSEDGTATGAPRQRSALRATAGAVKRLAVDQWVVPRLVAGSGADLFHSPNYLIPRRLSVPAVVDCHDLTLLDHFDTKQRGPMRRYERRVMVGSLGRARMVVTPSRTVREQLLERFDLDPERVVAIYPPPPDLQDLSASAADESRQPAPARGPYFLTVGTLEPRKNLLRLLQAHDRVWNSTRIPLLLVGPYGWRQRALLRRLRRSPGVHWLGWVDDVVLGALYRRATAVVQPSLAEGFDQPVLEAMAAGAPLVLSELPVHREVAGDLALYAPAGGVEALAARMTEVSLWDDGRRSSHARTAAAKVETLARRSGLDRYLEVYKQALTS